MRRLLLGMGLAVLLAAPSMASAEQRVDRTAFDQSLGYATAATRLSPHGTVSKQLHRLCPLVIGATPETNAYVASRLRQVAGEVGVEYEHRDCYPNLLVLFSDEPDQMLGEAWRSGRISYDGISAPRMRQFQDSVQPIRWVHGTGDLYLSDKGTGLYNSLVVIDARQTRDVPIAAIADYVSLVSLADIRPDAAQPAQASILNLFAGGATAPAGLTETDRAYLRGVYAVNRRIGGQNQVRRVAAIMAGQ